MVIAIIAVLIALLLPAVQQAREAARRSQCKNNLKQLGLALHNYHEVHGVFPIGRQTRGPGITANAGGDGGSGWGWTAFVLPFIDQAPLYNQIDFNRPMNENTISKNRSLCATVGRWALCPSDSIPVTVVRGTFTWATTNYQGNMGAFNSSLSGTDCNTVVQPWPHADQNRFNGVFGSDSRIRLRDITDGTTNTIAVGELAYAQGSTVRLYGSMHQNDNGVQDCGSSGANTIAYILSSAQGAINLANPNVLIWGSVHTGGAHFVLCDGSVRFISENIHHTARTWSSAAGFDPYDRANGGAAFGTYQRLAARHDGLTIGEF